MFGAKYSRLKFWIISICLFIPDVILIILAKVFERAEQYNNALVLYIIIFLIAIIWLNTLANRIRDYGSNPWISLFALIPLVNIGLALYYGIAKDKNKPENNEDINKNETSLPKAVYNHSKDIASEVKPAIEEHKGKYKTTSAFTKKEIDNSEDRIQIKDFDDSYFSKLKQEKYNYLSEDEIYEKIMIEIEEDKKVKSTWAKALAQSDGDRDKAESLYIKSRFIDIKNEIKKTEIVDSKLFCGNCGENLEINSLFCGNCGTKTDIKGF